jgi:hypothetical protein
MIDVARHSERAPLGASRKSTERLAQRHKVGAQTLRTCVAEAVRRRVTRYAMGRRGVERPKDGEE